MVRDLKVEQQNKFKCQIIKCVTILNWRNKDFFEWNWKISTRQSLRFLYSKWLLNFHPQMTFTKIEMKNCRFNEEKILYQRKPIQIRIERKFEFISKFIFYFYYKVISVYGRNAREHFNNEWPSWKFVFSVFVN